MISYNADQVAVMLEMINDESIGKDCKILYIIQLVHSGNISLEKADELLVKSGICEHGLVVEAKYMKEFSRRYKKRIENKS